MEHGSFGEEEVNGITYHGTWFLRGRRSKWENLSWNMVPCAKK
jgi:hypothetical protein